MAWHNLETLGILRRRDRNWIGYKYVSFLFTMDKVILYSYALHTAKVIMKMKLSGESFSKTSC